MAGKRSRPQKERQLCPAECSVCGAAASGYHYEAPSCTSCKTFFRRTVLQERVYNGCYKGGLCTRDAPDVSSVRLCRSCRFDRCIAGGMNPLLIVSLANPCDNPVIQKLYRKIPKEEDDQQPSTSKVKEEEKDEELPVVLKRASPSLIECKIERIIGGLLYLENAHQRLRASTFAPMPMDGHRLDAVLSSHSRLSLLFQEAHAPPVDPVTNVDRGPPMSHMPHAKKLWPFADLFCAVEYIKTFEFFHYLTSDDKKALCQHVVVMCSHLTLAYFSFEHGSDITLHPDGTKPHGGKVAEDNVFEWQLHHGLIVLLNKLNMDRKEYVLLKAIVVCNPAIEGLSLSNKDQLEKERLKYSRSLMSYVMCTRGSERGPAAYTAMLAVIDTLSHLMKKHKDFHVTRNAFKYRTGNIIVTTLFNDLLDF